MKNIFRNIQLFSVFFLVLIPIANSHEEGYLPLKAYVGYPNNFSINNETFNGYIEICSKYNRTPLFNICMVPYYTGLVKDMRTEDVLIKAENDLRFFPNITDCHFIGHEIGSANFKKNNYDVVKSIAECGRVDLCGGGCHHQIFIDIIGNNTEEGLINISEKYCSGKYISVPEDFGYLCYHAIGHSLLLISEYNLNKSIGYCYNQEKDYNYECLDGVFHQYYFLKLDYDFDNVAENIELLCPQYLSGLARRACFERAGKFALTYFGYHDARTFEKGFELCSKLSFVDGIKCMNGLFVFPENCDKGELHCKYLYSKTILINYFIELFN